jgi:molybdate transport system substrate-binding protein
MISTRSIGAAFIAAIALLAGNSASAPAADKVTLTALVASSAKPPYDELVAIFQKKHPNVTIETQYLGGGVIAKNVDEGAAADIVLVGSTQVLKVKNVVEGTTDIYRTKDIIITPKSNPKRIRGLNELANPGVRLSVGSPSSAVGTISSQIIQKASEEFGGQGYLDRIRDNVIKPAPDKGQDVVDAVEKGTADAAIVFITDGDPSKFHIIEIPDKHNVISIYQGTVAKAAKNAALGHEFIALMASPEGQAIFKKHKYLPPK